jgi:hypothetical protein
MEGKRGQATILLLQSFDIRKVAMDFIIKPMRTPLFLIIVSLPFLMLHSVSDCQAAQKSKDAGTTAHAVQGMQKVVTKQATFVLYVPKWWKVSEGSEGATRYVTAADPSGRSSVFFSTGTVSKGENTTALAKHANAGLGHQSKNLEIRNAFSSRDGSSLVYDGTYSPPKRGKTEFRTWVSQKGNDFTLTRIEAPAGQFEAMKPLLLTVMSNIRVTKGSFTTQAAATPAKVNLVNYRLRDGSASFLIPQGWKCQDHGKGLFIAGDPAGYSFISGQVDLLSPQLRVNTPGILVSPYLNSHQAWQFITACYGLASHMRFEKVYPRKDLMSQAVQAGIPASIEEYVYTFTNREGRACKGFTFGMSIGSRSGLNWNFRHLTVTAPANQFNAWAGTLGTMMGSYRINERWAQAYVAQGQQRLREMQKQTSAMVARNAQEIRQTMQAAYDERQKSQDYIDYQRTNYIRGQQDWISNMEGGTVYRTDSWGTKNTATGEYWEGKAYDYYHFKGKNPKYNEQMQPVDSRALWERHVR